MTRTNDRCTGDCCEKLTIPIAPHELQASWWQWKNGGEQVSMSNEKSHIFSDIHMIAPMLVYLGAFKKPPVDYINPRDEVLLNGEYDEPKHYYRCKHFDSKEKKCTVYEMRPAMCRAYPYGHKCNYAGCTWKGMKEKRDTKTQRAKRLHVLQDQRDAPKDKGGDWKNKEVEPKPPEVKVKPKRKAKRKRLGRGIAALIPKKKRGRNPRSPTT